ncbi:MAG TPA: VanZ family protein [Candidatus Eisenbacteria bacterium]|nr:VanZ family protein [Candidatus Eisenbacteria bacterium]
MAAESRSGTTDEVPWIPAPLRIAAALYTLFVLYGCLIPLDFTPIPWDRAWAVYRHIPEFKPGHFSRTDFTANVLLFMPLAFLWAGSIGAGWKRLSNILLGVVAWAAAVLFQAAIEFAQIYTPPRNVQLWDVIAAAWGAGAGVIAWYLAGGVVRRAFHRWDAVEGRQGVAGWLVTPYAVVLFFYNILPADLTLSASALYRKWDRGLIRPIPFTSLGDDPVTAVFGIGSEALLWLPLAALLVLGRGWRRFSAWGVTVLFAVAIETMQLLVQSRVSDSTDILCAAAGAAAGVWLGARFRAARPGGVTATPLEPRRRYVGVALAAIAWSVVLVFGFCYPFHFHYDVSTLRARIDALTAVPFRTYWLATEARAVSDLLLQLVLFAPFGAVAAFGASRHRAPWAARAAGAASFFVAGGVAAGIEALQVFLPGKVPDSTDIVVAAIGGLGGYLAARALARAARRVEAASPAGEPRSDGADADRAEAPPSPEPRPPAATWIGPAPLTADDLRLRSKRARRAELAIQRTGIAYFLLIAFGFFAVESSAVPYNVRELFMRGGHVALLGFPLVLLAAFAPPMIFSRWCARGEWRRSIFLPLFVLVHGVVVWTGIRVGAPVEAIHDIVGSPVLGWWGDLEIMLRFLGLFAAVSTLYTGGAHLAAALVGPHPDWDRRALSRWIFMAAPILGLSYLIVVKAASTDNLTELMAGGGSLLACFWLAIWILNLGASASIVAAVMRRRANLVAAVVLAAGGVAFGWMALTLGSANQIDKYGASFSAMQFLFSTDRNHYSSGADLLTRYVIAHVGVVLMAALVQMPFAGRRHLIGASREESQ